MKKKIIIIAMGEVQGVNFRSMVKFKALEFNLTGYVANRNDGTVLVEAEGKDSDLNKLFEWIKANPGNSKILDLKVEWHENEDIFDNFEIKW